MANDISVIIFLIGLAIGWAILIGGIWWWLAKPRRRVRPNAPVASKQTPVGTMLLAIDVPKENDKQPMAAESLFASLHGIGQDHLSFEIEAKEKSIRFYVWLPTHLRGYVESQLYAQYPEVNIIEMRDYTDQSKIPAGLVATGTELVLGREDFYPIKTFQNFEVDPLAAITGTLSKLTANQHVWIQMIIKPEDNRWRDAAIKYINDVKAGTRTAGLVKGVAGELAKFGGEVLGTVLRGGTYTPTETEAKKVELSPGVETALKEIEAKSSKLGFRTNVRVVVMDTDAQMARSRLQLTVGVFKQFNTNNLNSFEVSEVVDKPQDILLRYAHRVAGGPHSFILNVTELASIYHLPNISVVTPNIVWAGSKKGEPPSNLPLETNVPAQELTVLAKTNFRGSEEKFGIKLKDRRRHVYIIGKSGVGKSVLLKNMLIDDIREGRGAAMIDPHGEDVMEVLDFVPNYRVNDVVVFDPGDPEYAIGFNMFEVSDPKYKVITASGIVGSFKNIFGDSWGPRLEYWLKSAVLALLDYPGSTLMMVPRLFTDKDFRNQVLDKVRDPLIKSRWINEWPKLDQRAQGEAIAPILNKVGQFLSSPVIRNIVGQPKSSIDFRKAMDEGKIILVKLSKGVIGDDNSNLLGSMIVTQFQLAAMSRADIAPSARKDFYLYVDEFQNFATDSFATILSEARKYNLSLTVANQYMAQLSDEVRAAIFGNVGTLIAFRVGGEDATSLMKELAPVFDENDLVNLNIYNIYLKLSIDGLTVPAFSAQTLPPPEDKNNNAEKIVALSRERYAKPISFVEQKVRETLEESNFTNTGTGSRPASASRPWRSAPGRTDNLPNRPVPFRPGLKVDLPGGSPTLKEAIAEVQKKFPAPASSDQPSQNKKAPRGRVKPE
ncbi:MAG: TraM recognition domain-containing protein, partial [Patescibacteria group bacterium]